MHHISVQYAVSKKTPGIILLRRWANAALSVLKNKKIKELTIRIVGNKEMTKLNFTYRGKKKPTNVLAFPYDDDMLLGDIVICNAVVKREAHEQHKLEKAHWAHMVIHGTLHLLGYDHIKEKDAKRMESTEIRILTSLGFPNPYQLKANNHG